MSCNNNSQVPLAIPFRSSDKDSVTGGRGLFSHEYPTGEHPWRKLYSRITESSTWRSLTAKQIAVWICTIAKSHSQDKDLICQHCGHNYTAPRGSYSHSVRWTATTCMVDKNTVVRTFKALEQVGFWTKQGRGCHVWYLINKFDEYQQVPTETHTGTQTDMHRSTHTETHLPTQTNIKEVEVEVEVSDDIKAVAGALRKSILSEKPDYRNLDSEKAWSRALVQWSREIDLMIRRDDRDPSRQLLVLKWLAEGTDRDALFWRKNILSAKKFREQFDRLEIAMRHAAKGTPRPTYGRTDQLVTDEKADDWNKEIL